MEKVKLLEGHNAMMARAWRAERRSESEDKEGQSVGKGGDFCEREETVATPRGQDALPPHSFLILTAYKKAKVSFHPFLHPHR